jgi:hypothetical protein
MMYIDAIMSFICIFTTHYGIHLQLIFYIMIPIDTTNITIKSSLLNY